MSNRATKPELEALHALVSKKLTDAITGMETGEKGLAALINTARQFLKDNNIELLPFEGSALGSLAGALEDLPFDPNEDAIN